MTPPPLGYTGSKHSVILLLNYIPNINIITDFPGNILLSFELSTIAYGCVEKVNGRILLGHYYIITHGRTSGDFCCCRLDTKIHHYSCWHLPGRLSNYSHLHDSVRYMALHTSQQHYTRRRLLRGYWDRDPCDGLLYQLLIGLDMMMTWCAMNTHVWEHSNTATLC